MLKEVPGEIRALENSIERQEVKDFDAAKKVLKKLKDTFDYAQKTLSDYSSEAFENLDQRAKNLHLKAFATNSDDPDYHNTETLSYSANGKNEEVKIPKGDILRGFRNDVNSGKLPTVSWLVAPQKFSDHPSAPWYGAWYVSEVLDILTQNPEVWKKTIFIINYDENDGYFDHIPPFVAPNENNPRSGKVSNGLSTLGEFVTKEQELAAGFKENDARESPVGLGYRVPLVIASPWSKGGWVNSQVCDLTSSLMFLEKFLSKKTGKEIHCPNISSWRREICGDLTSMFREFSKEDPNLPPLDQTLHIKGIHQVRNFELPKDFQALKTGEISTEMFENPQERGVKPSNIIPYELYCDLSFLEGKALQLNFGCGNKIFGKGSVGAPFKVFASGEYKYGGADKDQFVWDFAVKRGSTLDYKWEIDNFQKDNYHLSVQGPNGFWREFKGPKSIGIPVLVKCKYEVMRFSVAELLIEITNQSSKIQSVKLEESTYRTRRKIIEIKPQQTKVISLEISKEKGWYDFTISDLEHRFEWAYSGRVDTKSPSTTDPLLGGLVG